jgi:PAS domain S-box-containing protein
MCGRHYMDFVAPQDKALTLEQIRAQQQGGVTTHFTNHYIHKDGRLVPLQWSGVWSEEEQSLFGIARDATPHRQVQQQMDEQEALHRALVENGTDMLALLDEAGNYLYAGGAILKMVDYTPEDLVGRNAFTLIHPDDLPRVQAEFTHIMAGTGLGVVSAFRFITGSGEWRWVETAVNNQIGNPHIRAIVVSSRDVTEYMLSRQALQEEQARFRSLFDNNPDLILFHDQDGFILNANPAFLAFVHKARAQVVGRRLADLLPPTLVALFEDKFQEVARGNTVRFETIMQFDGLPPHVFSVTKVPLLVDSSVWGVHVVMRDITEVAKSQQIIQGQARKLTTLLESITDACFFLDKNWDFTYVNEEYEQLLGVDRQQLLGRNVWDVFPPEQWPEVYQRYHQTLETGQAYNYETYYIQIGRWLEVKVFPSEEGLSVYFSDITEKVKARQELERLSLVASKTSNGVIISDSEGYTEWVNDGFTKLTGYTLAEVVGKRPRTYLHGPDTDQETEQRIGERIDRGEAFTEEIVNYTKEGKPIWVSLDITPVLDDSGKLVRFIALQTDITPLKEAEARQLQLHEALLSEQQAYLRQVIDTIPNLLYLNKADGQLGFTNAAYRAMEALCSHTRGGLQEGDPRNGRDSPDCELDPAGADHTQAPDWRNDPHSGQRRGALLPGEQAAPDAGRWQRGGPHRQHRHHRDKAGAPAAGAHGQAVPRPDAVLAGLDLYPRPQWYLPVGQPRHWGFAAGAGRRADRPVPGELHCPRGA